MIKSLLVLLFFAGTDYFYLAEEGGEMALLIIKVEDHFSTEGYERKGCARRLQWRLLLHQLPYRGIVLVLSTL